MFDLEPLIKTVGYLGLFAIVFAESGLFIGFFLPGDSLLFTAGILASQGFLNIWLLCPILFAGAVLGDNFGYAFGRKVGPKIFNREESLLFHKDHILRAQRFYQKHGGKALIVARFMPVIRTFAPILAGVGRMNYLSFMIYNVIGALLWAVILTLLGYGLGKTVPNIDAYIIPIIIFIVIASVLPGIIKGLRDPEIRKKLKSYVIKS